MGKKKNVEPINLNSGPLKSVTIGEIKQSKYSWVWIALMFVLFCAIIFFLPDINRMYLKLTKGESAPSVIDDTEPDTKKDETPEKEDSKYKFADTTKVDLDSLSFSDITYNDGALSLKVLNNTNNPITLDDQKLYFVLYDEAGSILNVISLKGVVNGEGPLDLNYQIKSGAVSFEIKPIEEEDYTYIDINVDSEGKSVLTCEKGREKIIYSFANEELNKIEHTNIYDNTNANYNDLYDKYNSFANKYGTSNGISASLSTDFMGFNYRMVIDYTVFDEKIDYQYYFEKGTSPRIVNFILEADLYNCS